jgi:hypothetical protein
MSERVVDALEVVEIENGEPAETIAVAGRHGFGDQFVEVGAVRQAGQIVETRHGADLLLRSDALRHVLEGDDAEFLAAFAGRELEMLAVGKRNEDLAVPALAQRARQLPLDERAILGGEHAARHAAHQHGMHRTPEQRVGRLERHQVGGFRIRHHDATVWPEHDQPMRHGVERPVEALGDAVRLLLLADRGEQNGAHQMRHLVDREHERDDEQTEHEMIEVALQHQPERDRRQHGHGQYGDHLAGAEIASCDRDRAGQHHGYGCYLAERVRRDIEADESEQSDAEALDRAGHDVVALPAQRGLVADDAFRIDPADGEIAAKAGGRHHDGENQIDRFPGFPIDKQADQPLGQRADEQDARVREQRPDEADINVFRYLVGFVCFHACGAARTAVLA